MKRAVRIALGSAVLVMGLAIAGAAPAAAQVRFRGSFPFPHGRISVGVADPAFSVGTYVPEGYVVYQDPEYGYGFAYEDQWISCERHGSRWVIVERPVFFGRRDDRFVRRFQGHGYGFSRRDWRADDRGFGREDRRFRDNRSFERQDRRFRDNRGFGREDRRFRDNRRDGRRDRDSRDRNNRWTR
jgi:hypothetical protein